MLGLAEEPNYCIVPEYEVVIMYGISVVFIHKLRIIFMLANMKYVPNIDRYFV